MTDRTQKAMRAALGKRGKYFNRLKAKCPPMGSDAAIFWQAAMMELNPHKVSIGQIMVLRGDEVVFFEECSAYVRNMHSAQRKALELDRAQLTSMGVW